MADHFLLLRVRVTPPTGWLRPLWFTVGDRARFAEMTTVDGEYTIAVAALIGRTIYEAFDDLRGSLSFYAPLLGDAKPEPWLVEQMPMTFGVQDPRIAPAPPPTPPPTDDEITANSSACCASRTSSRNRGS
ncbi:MAG TPA: hypothetical protein VLT45_04505 [Kofleriaceae bacterium]|nr:hypothetical protein [Kofleriaceae bacterium]